MESEKSTMVDPCRLRIDRGNCVSCAACPSVCHTLALDIDAHLMLPERIPVKQDPGIADDRLKQFTAEISHGGATVGGDGHGAIGLDRAQDWGL